MVDNTRAYLIEPLEKETPVYEHSLRVEKLSEGILNEMGTNGINKTELKFASRLHDASLVYLGDYEQKNELHPEMSGNILQTYGISGSITNVIKQHHERMDGSGFPRQLKEEDILKMSKILITADSFDSLMCRNNLNNVSLVHENYKKPSCIETSLKILKNSKKHSNEHVNFLENFLEKEGYLNK